LKILYIVIGDLGMTEYGSGVRPNCMYRAFLERGHTVYALSGYEGRGEGKLRAAEVQKAMQWAEENHPDLCYIESSTYPLIHRCDYTMIRWLCKKNIPTAYFYRDFYHKFPGQFPKRSGFVNRLKDFYLDWMRILTDRILHKIAMVYFPSEESLAYFPYQRKKTLGPAGDASFLPEHESTKTSIYVGGINDRYGFPVLIEAFRLLNREVPQYRLILVCRENEFKQFWRWGELPAWLELHHASGKELEPLYAKADLGLIALEPNPYNNVAVCIKLYQYLSFGLPVLSTDTDAMTSIIRDNGFGRTAAYDAEAFAEAVAGMLRDEQLKHYSASIRKNMTEKNLWVHRVDQIVEDLLG